MHTSHQFVQVHTFAHHWMHKSTGPVPSPSSIISFKLHGYSLKFSFPSIMIINENYT
jgi:hypothetical protein